MNVQDLRKLLEETDDKFSIFASLETLKKYSFNGRELLDLISDFLTDEEIMKLFECSHFQQFNSVIRECIINGVSDEFVKLQMICNDNVVKDIPRIRILDIMNNLSDAGKTQLLYNQEIIEKYQIQDYESTNLVSKLENEAKKTVLNDKDLILDKLGLHNWQIAELANGLENEAEKKKVMEAYELENYLRLKIISTFGEKSKLGIVLEEERFDKNDKLEILRSMSGEGISEFLNNNREFYTENNIHPYEITRKLDTDKQKDFVARLEALNLTLNEKREILATLNQEVKQSIDTNNMPEEYKTAVNIQTEKSSGRVIFDMEKELEDYRGLDNLMVINPEQFTEEQRTRFMQLCDICPNMQVDSDVDGVKFATTASEYKEAEEWINSVISNLNPEYSMVQKMAVIDNAIGRKISYSPDFNTEVFNANDSRALWKIIASGYGVCNGIARVEQYMLNRIGIESEIIPTSAHAFLKIKDIELPLANGEVAKGNTILDPTWNLTSHRFGGRPDNFCKSYEEIRKNDVDANGRDHGCHRNDEKLQGATLNLDEQGLRSLFTSVGLADKDGKFPIKDLFEKSKLVDEFYANQPEQNINKQFLLLSKVCPEFATCQNSSMSILKDVLLNNENLRFNKCVVNRVYDRADKGKEPVLFVYIDSDELGQKFYSADKTKGQFVELPKEDFTKQFECYEEDLKKYKRS